MENRLGKAITQFRAKVLPDRLLKPRTAVESWELLVEERKKACIKLAVNNGHSLGTWRDEVCVDPSSPDRSFLISKSVCQKEVPNDTCLADAWFINENGVRDFSSYGGLAIGNFKHGYPYGSLSYYQGLASQLKEGLGSSSLTAAQNTALMLGVDSVDRTLRNVIPKS